MAGVVDSFQHADRDSHERRQAPHHTHLPVCDSRQQVHLWRQNKRENLLGCTCLGFCCSDAVRALQKQSEPMFSSSKEHSTIIREKRDSLSSSSPPTLSIVNKIKKLYIPKYTRNSDVQKAYSGFRRASFLRARRRCLLFRQLLLLQQQQQQQHNRFHNQHNRLQQLLRRRRLLRCNQCRRRRRKGLLRPRNPQHLQNLRECIFSSVFRSVPLKPCSTFRDEPKPKLGSKPNVLTAKRKLDAEALSDEPNTKKKDGRGRPKKEKRLEVMSQSRVPTPAKLNSSTVKWQKNCVK